MIALNIPLHAAVTFSRNSHSCLMLAATARLNMSVGGWVESFLESAPKNQIADIVKDLPADGIIGRLLKNSLVTEKRFEAELDRFMLSPTWHTSSTSLGAIHLASSLLSSEKIEGLLSSLPKDSMARAALMANPNRATSHIAESSLSPEEKRNYQEALSIYGDLASPSAIAGLSGLFTAGKEAMGIVAGHRTTCLENLSNRSDLTRPMAKQLNDIVQPYIFAKLVKTPIHQQMVREGIVDGVNPRINGERDHLVLSPAMSSDAVMAFLHSKEDFDDRSLRVIGAHPNAPNVVVGATISAQSEKTARMYGHLIVESQSPHAEETIVKLRRKFKGSELPLNVAELVGASSALLKESLKECWKSETWDSVTRTMCHTNFPWKEFASVPEELKGKLPGRDYTAVQVAHAQAGNITSQVFEKAINDERAATALLFAPSLSSHRLGKLVERHPEIAPLAAIHPNGFNVDASRLKPESRAIVNELRYAPLAGSSTPSSVSGKPTTLAI